MGNCRGLSCLNAGGFLRNLRKVKSHSNLVVLTSFLSKVFKILRRCQISVLQVLHGFTALTLEEMNLVSTNILTRDGQENLAVVFRYILSTFVEVASM
jgi:hypothetical protein